MYAKWGTKYPENFAVMWCRTMTWWREQVDDDENTWTYVHYDKGLRPTFVEDDEFTGVMLDPEVPQQVKEMGKALRALQPSEFSICYPRDGMQQ